MQEVSAGNINKYHIHAGSISR